MSLPDNWKEIQAESEKWAVGPDIVRQVLARVPPSWAMVEESFDGALFRRGGVQVIITVAREYDNEVWVHVSGSERKGPGDKLHLLDWEQLKRVKNDFLGDAYAYQVFPPSEDYVNLQPVLHLWARLDGKAVLPDFTHGMKSI